MITVILTAFIVIGMALVFIARRQLKNIQQDEEIINTPEVVEQDAYRIRQELEQTTNEIIQRMAERIDRLELLIREADRKSNMLQRKIEKLEKLERGDRTNDADFSYLLNESMAQPENPQAGKLQGNMAERAEAVAKTLAAVSSAAEKSVEDDPDTYSIELTPDQLEAYLKSRSVDEIPDKPVKSLVDEEPEEYRPPARPVRDIHPQEQAAYLQQQMNRR